MAIAFVVRGGTADDYDRVIVGVDAWWGGRSVATMLPRLFFQHFGPWTFVAEKDANIIGFLAGFRSQTDERQAYCHFVGVSPEARGLGVGAALYDRLCADAAAAGCTQVFSVTSPSNTSSIAFHRGLGFDLLAGPATANDIPYVPNYDGPGEDRVRFVKRIGEAAVSQVISND